MRGGLLPCAEKYQNAVLLAASWLFYAFATRHGCLCWFWDSLASYAAVRWMARAAGAARRRRLWLAVGLNLGLLAGLKALGAALAGLNAAQDVLAALEAIGLSASAQRFSLILPLGISFFTLQAIGCAVDVYREKCPVPAERGAFLPVHKLFRLYFLRTHHAGRQLSAAASGAAPL